MIFGSESLPLQKKCDQAFQLVKPLLTKKKIKRKKSMCGYSCLSL